jgi:DNA-binding NarL/FixJ family response regulator
MRATGDTSRAAAMWTRGHRLASSGGARLFVGVAEDHRPPVIGERPAHVDELAVLTTREREIAQLVAEGRTSHAIATKLYLSRRTVETHVSRVYRKTGVSSRVGLVALMARNGSPPIAGPTGGPAWQGRSRHP